ncbi:MAG: V-type ATP synthase subunit A [Bacteroidetes bacterium]|nr:V-type ATP synthase subunit A [Bacteroidota bacterium]
MNKQTHGVIKGIISNLMTIEPDGPVIQNEMCFIDTGKEKLLGEVIKVNANTVSVQVYDSTRGLTVGTKVEFTGSMLEIQLGPGILSKRYDGLQNDLEKFEGTFLKRGEQSHPLETESEWNFTPLMKTGDIVNASDWLGQVEENGLPHKIMAPFNLVGSWKIKTIVSAGTYKLSDTIATLENETGKTIDAGMINKWPAKIPLKFFSEKLRPFKLLETGVRTIDSLHPMLEGGTGFIPGPFGAGKTVLQHALAKQATADVVVVAACGERANEVVEIFKEFPELIDPKTGRKLMERTVIIANTSNMPVAAREASVYTAMTICEYYRNMGLKVLLLADSTSRWAQALREMSNRLEELPGPDAFPMDLPAVISNFYSRAGYVQLNNKKFGSITFIGTVSPAGGNFKEPVTESTKKAARCFYALSQRRADSKRYPAVDPIDSYSKYLEYPEFKKQMAENISGNWIEYALEMKNFMLRAKESFDQINILGDDGVPVEFHVQFWKGELLDFVILQQDAFDDIDQMTPVERQLYMNEKILSICNTDFQFEKFSEVRPFFRKLINICKQMNYAEFNSEPYKDYEKQLDEALAEQHILIPN